MFQLSFLNSSILFLSSALVIPIIIYLFAKKKPRKLIFSSIRFIKAGQQQKKKKIQIKNLLLLLIRIMIILFTILAISRPVVKTPLIKADSKHPKTAIVIIVDNSYSMNYLVDTQTQLDKAKEIVLKINSLLEAEDNTLLMTLDESWNELHSHLGWGSFSENLIKNIKITPSNADFREIYQTAERELTASHFLNKEIYFITDEQRAELPQKIEIPTFIIPTSKMQEFQNISCQKARLVNNIVNKELREEIEFELVNHSKKYKQDVVYQLFLDGNTIAEKVTDLQPSQRKKLSFQLDLTKIGWHSGYVNVKNERLLFDNRSYFSFYHDPEPKIAILSDREKIPLVLETLLEIYTENSRILQTDNINYDVLKKYDNIIIYDKFELSEKIEFILDEFYQEEKGVIFLTTENLSPSWQNYLAKKFSTNFQQYSKSVSNLDFVNRFHPVTQLLKEQTSLQIADLWQVESSANILLQAEKFPLAIEKNRWILWLFDVNSKKTAFTVSTAFPVFAYNCLRFTGSENSFSYHLGDKLQLSSEQLILPNEKTINVQKKSYFPEQSGLFEEAGKIYAVNLNYQESEFNQIQKSEKKNLFWLDENWQENILQSRYGFELWKYLVLAAILLLLLEMFIIKKEEKQN